MTAEMGSARTIPSRDWRLSPADGVALASRLERETRAKNARVLAVRLWIRLGHDPVAASEISQMLDLSRAASA